MSDENTNSNGAVDPANALASLWAQCFEQANDQARVMLAALNQAGDPGEIQKRWLEAVGQSLDGFMRTPAFLESMRQNLKLMTDLKSMQDQYIQDTGRALGIPLATDIAGLYERLHSHEHAILDRLGDIEERLRGIEAALGAGRVTVLEDRLDAEDRTPSKSHNTASGSRAARSEPPAQSRRVPKRGPK